MHRSAERSTQTLNSCFEFWLNNVRRFLNNNLEKKQKLKDLWSHDPTSLTVQLCFKYYSNHTTVLGFFLHVDHWKE